jgi:hypothetical protein
MANQNEPQTIVDCKEVREGIDQQLCENIESLHAEEAAVLSFLRARIEALAPTAGEARRAA